MGSIKKMKNEKKMRKEILFCHEILTAEIKWVDVLKKPLAAKKVIIGIKGIKKR